MKYNGVYYPAGTDVPVGNNNTVVAETKEEIVEPIVEKQPQYTKTEINRMPVDELRKLAMSTGVEGADKWTGAELKEYLIALMGL